MVSLIKLPFDVGCNIKGGLYTCSVFSALFLVWRITQGEG